MKLDDAVARMDAALVRLMEIVDKDASDDAEALSCVLDGLRAMRGRVRYLEQEVEDQERRWHTTLVCPLSRAEKVEARVAELETENARLAAGPQWCDNTPVEVVANLQAELTAANAKVDEAYDDIADTCAALVQEYMATPEDQLHMSAKRQLEKLLVAMEPIVAPLRARVAELEAAIARGGWDVCPCMVCGEDVVCLPDGMPMCEECNRKEAAQGGGEG